MPTEPADRRAEPRMGMIIGRSAPILMAAALVAACDRAEPTATTASVGGAGAQLALTDGTDDGIDVPEWVGNLLGGMTAMSADSESTQEELPGMGHKFQLHFAMQKDEDPENLTNEVISVLTTADLPAGSGSAVRNLPPGIRIEALRNQMNLKYLFPARSCAGGSPRFQLSISTDGDREHDANAFGYVGNAPFGAGCITGRWDTIDMTDHIARWDLTQLGGSPAMTWDDAEAFIATAHPNHRVLTGSLVDDSCSFQPPSCGQAYYDVVTLENRTLENHQDAVEKK